MRRTLVTLAALATMAIPATALAGGWAVASFDEVPASLEADTTQTLEFTVLAHGQAPADWGLLQIQFTSGDETHVFDATNLGNGRYSVDVAVPAGSWAWSVIQQDYVLSSMGTINVTNGGVAATTGQPVNALRVILPIAAVIAAGFTVRELADRRRESAVPVT
jgi:hypothetical protein